jgi:hypothetical protein
MITIHELLRDEHYRKFICRVPTLPFVYSTPSMQPWRLIVQLKGEDHWRTKRFGTYQEAFKALKTLLPKIADGAINCPALDFKPPTRSVYIKGQYIMVSGRKVQKSKTIAWKPKLPIGENEDHHWCAYCRRPTVFRRLNHHNILSAKKLGGLPIDDTLFRCVICGASENIVNLKDPLTHQRWDVVPTTTTRKKARR